MIHHGNCIAWLASLEAKSVDHCIMDPPYDAKTHGAQRRQKIERDHKQKFRGVRSTSLGFDAITEDEIDAVSFHLARVVRRWTVIFGSVEIAPVWRRYAIRYGLEHVREGAWVKLCSTPQFSGDRPSQGHEAIEIVHPRGRKRWNGGGKAAIWTHSIVVNRGGKNKRDEDDTTPKPEALMLDLVDDFTEPGDLVIDPFAGMGTTGVACIRRGRRFLGCELKKRKAELANERLLAEAEDSTLRARASGQLTLAASM